MAYTFSQFRRDIAWGGYFPWYFRLYARIFQKNDWKEIRELEAGRKSLVRLLDAVDAALSPFERNYPLSYRYSSSGRVS